MKNPSTRFRKGKRDVNARNGLVMIFVCTKFSVRVRACSQCCVAFISVSICHALRKRTPFSAWWVLQEGIGEKRWTGTPKHLFLSWQYKRILNAMNETNIPFHGSVQTSQVAKTLRNIMRPNPAKARPKKRWTFFCGWCGWWWYSIYLTPGCWLLCYLCCSRCPGPWLSQAPCPIYSLFLPSLCQGSESSAVAAAPALPGQEVGWSPHQGVGSL